MSAASQNVQRIVYAARYGCVRLLARFSLFLLVMSCATGCFDAPPEYSEPTVMPPVIAADDCQPPLTQVILATAGNPIDFTVAFRADDANRSLAARAVRDIYTGDPQLFFESPIARDPRAFADQIPLRAVNPRLPTVGLKGCHAITAIIAEATSFYEIYKTSDHLQEARVTWFAWFSDPNDVRVDQCNPNSFGVSP